MEPLTILILIILGFFFAILSSMIGIGGGLLFTPTLDFVFGLETSDATFTSSFVIVFTSASAFTNFRSQQRIDFKTVKSFLTFAVPGVIIGALLADRIPKEILRQMFGIVVGIAAIRGILKAISNSKSENGYLVVEEGPGTEHRKFEDSDGNIHDYYIRTGFGKYFAFLGGLLGGMLGIGGGIIYMPIFTTYSGLPPHIAAATSTTMIVVVSIIAVITRTGTRLNDGTFGLQLWINYAIPMTIGSVIGARYGSNKVKKLDSQKVLILFWIVALIAGIRLIIQPLIS